VKYFFAFENILNTTDVKKLYARACVCVCVYECICVWPKKKKKLFIHDVQNDDPLLKYILKLFNGNILGRELTFHFNAGSVFYILNSIFYKVPKEEI